MVLTAELASSLARLPVSCVCREYPNMLAQVLNSPDDLRSPRELHPAFYGCFDWHSSVHGHWMLVALLRRFSLPSSDLIRDLLNANLTAENLLIESEYFERPNTQSFERPYGWAWVLRLAQELAGWDDPDGARWSSALQPLVDQVVGRYLSFFPRQTYPVRVGTHANSAFGLSFAWDFASACGFEELGLMVAERARSYYLSDADYATSMEPGGADFLSPCLVEADLMRRVLACDEFAEWLHGFVPHLASATSLLQPATVSDRSDPQIGHLDGLNLSRAWCMKGIVSALPADDPYCEILTDAAERHATEGLANIATGDYMGEHWLASFAVYLLLG